MIHKHKYEHKIQFLALNLSSAFSCQLDFPKSFYNFRQSMQLFDNPHWLVDSQDWAGLEVFLIHPFGLAYLQDLCVAQVLQATLELVQGIRLECQRSHDLLPHHLHYLQRKEKSWVRSSHMQEQHRLWRDSESRQGARANPLPIFGGSEQHIYVCSVPNRINDEVFIFLSRAGAFNPVWCTEP